MNSNETSKMLSDNKEAKMYDKLEITLINVVRMKLIAVDQNKISQQYIVFVEFVTFSRKF